MRRMRPTILLLELMALTLFLASPIYFLPRVSLVEGATPPIAAFTYFPCVLCAVPGDLVSFNANGSMSSPASILNYTWNFGDGSPPVTTGTPVTSHDYFGSPGQWLVTLTVEDSNGLTDTIFQRVLFYVYPEFDFHPTKPLAGELVSFNASASISYQINNTITSYDWTFGDRTTGRGMLIDHSYSAPGPYRVLLTLQTASGNPSISKTIVVGNIGSVGGRALAVDELGLIFPYIWLAIIVAAVAISSSFFGKKLRRSNDPEGPYPVLSAK